MKICFYALREYDELEYCKQFQKEFGIDFIYTKEYPSLENVTLARGCDSVSMTPCDMSADLVEAFHKEGVKYITCRSIGFDHVDREKAKELGMKVSNVSYPTDGVANYAIMLMMICGRRFSHILKRVELQDYTLKNKLGRDISSCTIGIIGTGKIGTTVIEHLSGFGCKMLAYDPYKNNTAKKYAEYTSLENIWKNADIITLHMNATDENRHLICKKTINQMKDGVIIINTARGRLIDSWDLIDGIEAGKIGAAGLDVLEDENGLYYYDHVGEAMVNRELAILRSFPNVVLSPHTAFYTKRDVSDMVKGCFESTAAFAMNQPTTHDVSL